MHWKPHTKPPSQMSFSAQDPVRPSWTTCTMFPISSPHIPSCFPHSPILIILFTVFPFVRRTPLKDSPESDECQVPGEGCCLKLDSWPLTPFTILIPAPSCPLSPTSTQPSRAIHMALSPYYHFGGLHRSIGGDPISVWLSLITFLLLRLKTEEAMTDQPP